MLTKTQTATKSHTECQQCGGNGWIALDLPKSHADFGKAVRCDHCTDWLAHSRLTEEERHHKLADIANRPDDKRGEIYVLRFLGKQMLDDPFGFLSIYGHKGGGKSLLLTALVAEFCRLRREAVYLNAGDVVTMLSAGDDNEIDGFRVVGNYEAAKKRLKSVAVLSIDEMDKIRWTPWQVQQIGEVIEHRHRNAARLVTLFAMNNPPWAWGDKPDVAGAVEHIASRFRDGRFHRRWPDGTKKPACLNGSNDVPGLFEVTLPDIRPTLRRSFSPAT